MKNITHYDLFAGIGGFSYALDQVFYDSEIKHIFAEWERFPSAILKKHWPDGTFYGDIADLVADTDSQRRERKWKQDKGRHGLSGGEISNENEKMGYDTNTKSTRTGEDEQGVRGLSERHHQWEQREKHTTIVTGGFPCQPFSHAGRRQGTSDDRYKWPEMFAVIKNVRPDWVIAENVRGLVTWNEGMVLEQVCADLESEGYEVQPLIIPACAVGAPHRRDRVWIVANRISQPVRGEPRNMEQTERQNQDRPPLSRKFGQTFSGEDMGTVWKQDWREVALATCHDGVDDGLPRRLDGATYRGKPTDWISAAQHRKERLKACGNAIVPQVAIRIFESIKQTTHLGKQ